MGAVYSHPELRPLSRKGDFIIQQRGGLYPALVNFQECEIRDHVGWVDFDHENHELPPVQYHAIVGSLDHGAREVYDKGLSHLHGYGGFPTI